MKRICVQGVSLLFLVFLAFGCGTIYKAAMDERSVSAQAKDREISLIIMDKITNDERLDFFDISVYSFEGHVYIVGEYADPTDEKQAVQVARNTEGVKDVTAYMLQKKTDDPCGTKVNLTLTAKVKGELIKDKAISSTNIEVKAIQCRVVLLGIVGTKEQIQKAIAHAEGAEGVKGVVSFLKPTH